jgi:urease accessory protein
MERHVYRVRNAVIASAEIVAVPGSGGTTRLPVLQSQVPLVLRRTPEAVYLVTAAAGPLGGDRLSLRITVRAGAALCLRTVAASLALPGPDGGESLLAVTATVEEGGCLEYLPEPVVIADAARHATGIRVTLAAGASLVLRDEVLLGRHGEQGGSFRTTLRVDYAGRPLLRQSLTASGTDPAALGPAILSGHRAIGSLLYVGRDSPLPAAPPPSAQPPTVAEPGATEPTATEWVAVMPLAGAPATLVTALAADTLALRRRLNHPK